MCLFVESGPAAWRSDAGGFAASLPGRHVQGTQRRGEDRQGDEGRRVQQQNRRRPGNR